jgi:hypothetical protein
MSLLTQVKESLVTTGKLVSVETAWVSFLVRKEDIDYYENNSEAFETEYLAPAKAALKRESEDTNQSIQGLVIQEETQDNDDVVIKIQAALSSK